MNINRGFLNLNTQECVEIYPEVLKNGDEFYACARLLAESSYYGKAIAYLILGAEEYIKGLCLFLEGQNFRLRTVEELRSLFKHHTPRHSIMRYSYSIWMVLKHLLNFTDESSKRIVFLNMAKAALAVFPAMNNEEWWKNADQLKQRGFYADFMNELKTPNQLTSEDFEEALLRTKLIPQEINQLINQIQKLTTVQLNSFRELFNQSGLHLLIAEKMREK